ncbi:MAG: ectonucleotide pyrophosphatase/phosphodiesterase [Gemmatimonadota bacterium]
MTLLRSIVAGALLLTGTPAASNTGQASPVVLISIDGLRPDYVLEADTHGLSIPNLRRFLTQGSYATAVRGVFPTVTYPSHTTLLTGVNPAEHGVYANTTFDPFDKNFGGWYWYASDIRVPTLWDVASKAGIVTANVHWPVSVGAQINYNIPQIWRSGMPDDRKLLEALSTPGILPRLEKELGAYADGIDESIAADETRGRFASRLIELERPGFTTVYFTALDHTQHATGPFSAESNAVLERIDAAVGRVIASAQLASGGHAVICIVSDHGFARTDKEVNLLVAFRSAGLISYDTAGKITSWRAAPWGAGASAAIVVADSADTVTFSRVRTLLDSLSSDSASGIARVVDASALRDRGSWPGAAFAVSLRIGYKLGTRSTGRMVAPVAVSGMHGYDPVEPEMSSAFFLMGPGVPVGKSLGRIDMLDIAPTLAGYLGVELPLAKGGSKLRLALALH